MTPAQLRAYTEVARSGSVRDAAAALGMSDAGVSAHVAALRRELGDPLYHRRGGRLVLTPGGLRLAARAVETLGLQEATRREVAAAADGRRVLRLAAPALFAEHAAPGLIELLQDRADDLEVELTVAHGGRAAALLATRAADVVVTPAGHGAGPTHDTVPFLRYRVLAVAAPGHPAAGRSGSTELGRYPWALGPSAAEPGGTTAQLLLALGVPAAHQRVHQSHAAALELARRGSALSAALAYAVSDDLAAGRLVALDDRGVPATGTWTAHVLARPHRTPLAQELLAFLATPRALRAMIAGSGADVGRFRPAVHVTLWR